MTIIYIYYLLDGFISYIHARYIDYSGHYKRQSQSVILLKEFTMTLYIYD